MSSGTENFGLTVWHFFVNLSAFQRLQTNIATCIHHFKPVIIPLIANCSSIGEAAWL